MAGNGHPTTPHRTAVAAVCFAAGFTPITALALSVLELVPMHVGGPIMVGQALVVMALAMSIIPSVRSLAARGLSFGLAAVLIYDGTRLPFVLLDDWPDFIPSIGNWLLATEDAPWFVGYVWRFLGNGAGMGLAFVAVSPLLADRFNRVWIGVMYGLCIWSGLMATILVAPNGEAKLFPLTAATIALSLLGHVVYGGTLGLLERHHRSGRVCPPSQIRTDTDCPTPIASSRRRLECSVR